MIHNNKGYAMALILGLLPIGLAMFFIVFSAIGFLQLDLGTKYPCRDQGLKTQRRVAPLLERLLSLNSKATKLKTSLTKAQAAQKIAISAQNPPAIAKYTLEIQILEAQRLLLDHQQKQIIQQSNLQLIRGHTLAKQQLSQVMSQKEHLFYFFKIKSRINNTSAPKLAVRPDYADIAPTYSPSFNFEKEQSMVHSWQYTVAMASPFTTFLQGTFTFEKSCSVTLSKEDLKWVAKINRDKSLSKSLW